MYTKEMMDAAVQVFLCNDAWRKYYETAPSDACRDRIAFGFCHSINNYQDYFKDLREFKWEEAKLESRLDLEDWKHLLKWSGHNPLRTMYRNKVLKLQAEQDRIAEASPEEAQKVKLEIALSNAEGRILDAIHAFDDAFQKASEDGEAPTVEQFQQYLHYLVSDTRRIYADMLTVYLDATRGEKASDRKPTYQQFKDMVWLKFQQYEPEISLDDATAFLHDEDAYIREKYELLSQKFDRGAISAREMMGEHMDVLVRMLSMKY